MRTPRAVRTLLLWLDQATCWHVNEVSHREDGVWSLRCLDCGRVSNGVDTKARYVGPKEAA
jgi:hypothetical protein